MILDWILYSTQSDGSKSISYTKLPIILISAYMLYNYYLRCRAPILVFKQLNDDGSKNDVLTKSGIDTLRYWPVFFYSSGFLQSCL